MAELKREKQRKAGNQFRRFHGITAVAELKPRKAGRRPKDTASFHGITAVAELKLTLEDGRTITFTVSTASQPWPN